LRLSWTLYDRRHHGGKVQSAGGLEVRPVRGIEIGEARHYYLDYAHHELMRTAEHPKNLGISAIWH
jgi:hypothetical protein